MPRIKKVSAHLRHVIHIMYNLELILLFPLQQERRHVALVSVTIFIYALTHVVPCVRWRNWLALAQTYSESQLSLGQIYSESQLSLSQLEHMQHDMSGCWTINVNQSRTVTVAPDPAVTGLAFLLWLSKKVYCLTLMFPLWHKLVGCCNSKQILTLTGTEVVACPFYEHESRIWLDSSREIFIKPWPKSQRWHL